MPRTYIIIQCKYCKTSFSALGSELKRGGAKYCTHKCSSLDKRSKKLISTTCQFCNKIFDIEKRFFEQGRYKFCSYVCSAKGRIRKKKSKLIKHVPSIIERFNNFVIKGNEINDCWRWKGYKDKNGYGRINKMGAHRLSYIIHFGAIPQNLLVCHKCDVPQCTNPNHLFLGTHHDNHKDMDSKNRRIKVRGSRHPNSKLLEQDILNIKMMHNKGIKTKQIVKNFNVGINQIRRIVYNKAWNHIKLENYCFSKET